MADELEPSGESPRARGPGRAPPAPTIWPFAFAGAVALILVGLVVSTVASAIGVALAVVFGFLWVRQATREVRGEPEPVEAPAPEPEVVEGEEGPVRYERAKFLEGATIGIGAAHRRGRDAARARVHRRCPPSSSRTSRTSTSGRSTSTRRASGGSRRSCRRPSDGSVSRRTAYVRYNGLKDEVPSFTIISNRCVHLGCPTQPQGPPGEPRGGPDVEGARDADAHAAFGLRLPVPRRRLRHRGQPGRRPARARPRPLRVLDHRREPLPRRAVQRRRGRPARAPTRSSSRYRWTDPGVHVDGPEEYLYPLRREDGEGRSPSSTTRLKRFVMMPLDWLEERSGLVGAVHYFLFRKVPHDTNWFHTLGSATLTAFIVQAVTGVILAFYYKPSPEEAYASIQYITNELTLGWLVRGMHRWGASVFIILLFLHMGRVFLFGAYKYPRELNWLLGVLLLVLGDARGLHRLPAALGPDRVLGDGRRHQPQRDRARSSARSSRTSCAEVRRSGPKTLSLFYSMHMLLIPGGLIGLIVLHLYLVIRLGVTSPPWSKRRGRLRAGRGRHRQARARRAAAARRRRRSADVRGRPEAHEQRAGAGLLQALQGGRPASAGSRSSRTRCSTTRS